MNAVMTTRGKRIQKSVLYKHAKFHVDLKGQSLKSLLHQALDTRATVGERRMNVGSEDHPVYHVLGSQLCETNGFVFGTLMTYTPGTDPLFLVDDADAAEVLLEKLKVPVTDKGKRREFLESLMFFGVIRNHLVLMQSQALKAPQLEAYLRWILHGAGVLPGDNTFYLTDTPTPSVRSKMDSGQGVRSIKLGGEVLPPSILEGDVLPASQQGPSEGKKSIERTQSLSVVTSVAREDHGVLAALKKLLSPAQAAKIDFDQLNGSNIEMSVTLRYKKETTEDGQKLMDTLGAALRNTEDVETVLTLNDGGTIRGADLKLSGVIKVTSYDGQLGASEVYEEMRQWLLSKVTTEEVSAE